MTVEPGEHGEQRRDGRWSAEHVAAIAPGPAALAAAETLAQPARWSGLGCDERAVWGRCQGSTGEPYETVVDHLEVASRCTCPSRRRPCKHALALLLMWTRRAVADAAAPASVATWVRGRTAVAQRRAADPAPAPRSETGAGQTPPADRGDHAAGAARPAGGERPDHVAGDAGPSEPAPGAGDAPEGGDRTQRDDRVARMLQGLRELDRWLTDRMRVGLADPALARYQTWDALAARLVDARAGSLANRVRRVAGLVGAAPEWQSELLAEIGMMHLIAQGGTRLPTLPGPLADAVATAAGWQVRQADVLAGAPETDDWLVLGRSDVREDRIEVRRWWLRGRASGSWALLLSFAAYQQVLDDTWTVGSVVPAELFRYPGGALRCLPGVRGTATPHPPVVVDSIRTACDSIGRQLAGVPWSDRLPVTLAGSVGCSQGRWSVTDDTGSLALAADQVTVATVLAAGPGEPIRLTAEWTPAGLVPLSIHLEDRTLDVGPRADPSFVGGR